MRRQEAFGIYWALFVAIRSLPFVSLLTAPILIPTV